MLDSADRETGATVSEVGKLAGLVLVLALAACGGGSDHSKSAADAAKDARPYVPPKTTATTTVSKASTTTVVRKAGSAIAIAKRLGCVDPKLDPVDDGSTMDLGLPNSIESVTCTAAGTEFDINVYASHADMERIFSPAGQVIVCGFVKAFGAGKGPFYSVLGDDLEVEASTPLPDGESGLEPDGTLEQAEALGRALNLPVHKFTCP